MTTLAFRSRPSVYPGHIGTATASLPRRETLAIVSTSSKLCGIAAYTAALRRQLSEAFDVTVFDLNQYLLRSAHRRVRRFADPHVKEICRALAGTAKTSAPASAQRTVDHSRPRNRMHSF